jgi:hypothetical protein
MIEPGAALSDLRSTREPDPVRGERLIAVAKPYVDDAKAMRKRNAEAVKVDWLRLGHALAAVAS